MNRKLKPKFHPYFLLAAALIFFLSAVSPALAQPVTLSLEKCISQNTTSSNGFRAIEQNYKAAQMDYRSFRTNLLPNVSANVNTPGFSRSINAIIQDDGSNQYVQQNQAISNASVSISQPILPTGGTVFVSSMLSRTDIFGNNGIKLWQTTPLLVGVSQPVFQYNNLKWQNRIAPVNYDIAGRQFLEQREDLAIDAATRFFDLYISGMRVENAKLNLQVNDSIFQISKGRFNLGKIAENDLLQTELASMNAKVDLANAKLEYNRNMRELYATLGTEKPDSVILQAPANIPDIVVNPDAAVAEALANRSDVLNFEAMKLGAESNLARARVNSRFNANINATFGLNQTGSSVQSSYSQPLNQQTFTIGFNVPLLQWGRAGYETQAAEARLNSTNRQIDLSRSLFEQKVLNAVYEFQQMVEQVQLAAKADTIAERRYEVAKSRYLVGKVIDITNLQIAQTEKNNARMAYYSTLKRYWIAYLSLRRATLYDFSARKKIGMESGTW
jgi:outer membrane protein TolC